MTDWYESLTRPPLTPPNWVFGPVWMVLYVLIAISIFLYYRAPNKKNVAKNSAVLVVHLIANAIWTYLFFGLNSPLLALIDVLILDVTLIFLIHVFSKASKLSAYLLIPYLLWVLWATYLNIGFLLLN